MRDVRLLGDPEFGLRLLNEIAVIPECARDVHRIDGRLVPAPSESGHADFAARSDREWELARMLTGLYGRATVEHVLSGRGIVNLHRFTHDGNECASASLVTRSGEPGEPTTCAKMSGGCSAFRCQTNATCVPSGEKVG